MHLLSKKYDTFLFDCDGVILNSNSLKIEAMGKSLESIGCQSLKIESCLEYFSDNFGRSRFHHIRYFIDEILEIDYANRDIVYQSLLDSYSLYCRELYLSASPCEGFFDMLKCLDGRFYVVSGSEQNELRWVFEKRNFLGLFNGVFGSPKSKYELVSDLVTNCNKNKCVMIGDAVSDLNAAQDNNIDFIFYKPYSNVKDKLAHLSNSCGYSVIESWEHVC